MSAASINRITCGETGEALYVHDQDVIRLSPHVHTDRSDGTLTVAQLAALARRNTLNFAVTDHNKTLPDGVQVPPPGIISGIEVTTQEGVHLVVIGPHPRIRAFFKQVIRPALPEGDPCFQRVRRSILEIIDGVRNHECFCMHPHYATVEGLTILDPLTQRKALEDSRDRGFVELHNSLLSQREYAWARRLAKVAKFPGIVAADAHWGVDQYLGTFNEVTACLMDQSPKVPLVSRLLRAMHDHSRNVRHVVRETPWDEFLLTAAHILRSNTPRSVADYFGKRFARLFHVIPSPNARTLRFLEMAMRAEPTPDRA